MHKYSYPYLGQLKFSSGAFILLVGVTRLWVKVTCGKFSWMGIIWKGTHVLIKGLTAENAYQSKNQALRSNKPPVLLRDRITSNYTSGEEFWKQFCFIEVSQNHVVSIIHNGRSLKQPGFFLELSSWPNWWRRALVRVVTKNLMVTQLSSMIIYVEIGETHRRINITATNHQSVLYAGVARCSPLLSEDTKTLGISKKHLKDSQTLRNKILCSDEPQFYIYAFSRRFYPKWLTVQTSSAHHLRGTNISHFHLV